MNWTSEQTRAINECGTNIIVSAGAGSGKTAVLTERVITKIKNGTNVLRLLILTFTDAASREIKERIRDEIVKNSELSDQLDYIDSAFICTFDSFSLSLVKKYSYLLNVSSNIRIIDESICRIVRSNIIDEIFEEKYQEKDKYFIKMITDLTIKSDTQIKKEILSINTKLDRLINKTEYLNNYIDNYYKEENINNLINDYMKNLLDGVKRIGSIFSELSNYCSEKYINDVEPQLLKLVSSSNYDEILDRIEIDFPRVKSTSEEFKYYKDLLYKERDNIKDLLIYKDSNHMKQTLLSTKDYAISIIDIILELDKRLNEYKSINEVYEFNDIALMAIKVIKDNNNVREELKDSFEEVMVDEYQDTSDIQDELITLLSSNNLYMVGDVKQSIYRFRNANPNIFKERYNDYSLGKNGIKIDLLNNFRSREEVLDDINKIFSEIMDESLGGADYKTSHQMEFGNNAFTTNKPKQNFNLEVYNYKINNKWYTNYEYEAFIIAKDIKNKIDNKFKIYDKNIKSLRNVQYDDFCILIDRKGNFKEYKKIFEYLNVPVVLFCDESIKEESDIIVIKSIIDLIIKIYKKEYDVKYNCDFYSVARSYLFNMSEDDFVKLEKNYYDTDIYKICNNIACKLDSLGNKDLIQEIIEKFDFYEKTISIGNIENAMVRIEYLMKLGNDLSSLGYSVIDFNDYLQDMITGDNDITIKSNTNMPNNVKLMSIHASKGLEYPICYYAGYTKDFNKLDLKSTMSFDKELGFILPFYDDGVGSTISKTLFKNKYVKEDISERIRLLYVALTRAKEKMIIVTDIDSNKDELSDEVRYSYSSFNSIINSVQSYIKSNIVEIDDKDLDLTKKYKYNNIKGLNDINSCEKIIVNEIRVENELIEESNISKIVNKLLSKEDVDMLSYGTKLHRKFEVLDFNNTNENDILKLKSHIKDIDSSKIYKEYEFITTMDNKKYHGIIDLLLEYEDHIIIVDYKTKYIDDENYKKQLYIYKEYIENKTGKKVFVYLYSIMDDILKEII